MTIISLTPKPTVTDQVRSDVVDLLRRALVEAESGNIDTVIVISHHVSGDWTDRASTTEHITESIGRLEIIKQEWIRNYLRQTE